MPKTKHKVCPNCANDWDEKEIKAQSCDSCGYPNMILEKFDEDEDIFGEEDL